ncbi:MAG: hypothetical protein AB7I30_13105 [Isosphaeraceae bacterium]
MEAHPPRAPSADGGLFASPGLSSAADLLDGVATRLARWDHDFQGRRTSRLRPAVRLEALALARAFAMKAGSPLANLPAFEGAAPRLVVAGHQPELFHPGVWVKNFAASAIAERSGAVALNLIVDNDLPKGVSLRVPHADGETLRIQRVEFDVWQGEIPYEDYRVTDEALFASFAERVRQTLPQAIEDPLIEGFWPRAVAARTLTDRVGLRFAMARHGVEADWGVNNLEVPLSAICESEGFLWFACHVLAHLPRFRQIHNDALGRYRALHGIRSRHHPVAALGVHGDWFEAPFWVWRATTRRRRPLLIRQRSQTMELRIGGEDQTLLEIPLSPDREACCAVERLLTLPVQGVRLRTRALTTTMFARYLLGDLFLHGIGGAKYDELGDEIARRFLGFDPPPYLTLSMTLMLGLPSDPNAASRLAAVDQTLRDLTFNPDRHLEGPLDGETLRLIEAKRSAIAGPVETHSQRVERFRELRRCNEALASKVRELRASHLAERDRLKAAVRNDALARSREYAIVLHSARKLRRSMTDVMRDLNDRHDST